MSPERWRQVKHLYESALEREEDQRSTFLRQACGSDEALLQDVEALLATHKGAGQFAIPPAEGVPKGIAEEQTDTAIRHPIASYQILDLLGEGGMGQVYRARDSRLGREVALKILPSALRSDPERMQRFVREARAASALSHPNVAHVYELGDAEGVSFIAMEYVRGQTLQSRMSGNPLDVPQILDIGIQVADALDEAHSKGITHRDIKPANLMLTPKGQLKVLDFGLAKFAAPEGDFAVLSSPQPISTAGLVVGTVPYMSPEQLLGREVDHRTDIFSLGVVLYEMTTGRLPFAGASPSERMGHILHSQPEAISPFNTNVPPELDRVIRKCLEKDPARRFQSARELLVDLKNLNRASDPGVATSTPSKDAMSKLSRSRRLLFLSAGAFVTAAMILYLSLFRGPPSSDMDIQSLAVMPLENLSGDTTQDYLADGITDALIADLAQINALRVMSRASVMRYKGTRKPPSEIARELKVDALVGGSVIRSEGRVRVSAQLVHAETENVLWAQSYERDLRDLLKVQNELVRMVAAEIKVKFTSQEEARIATVASVNPEAYDFYLRGRYYNTQRRTKLDSETAIGMLERAATLDPGFAAAHAELADAYASRTFFFAPEEKQWEEKAAASADRALSLDPDSAQAYVVRGRLFWTRSNHFPHERVAEEYRRAISVSPNFEEAHLYLAVVYNHVGLLDKGLQEAEEALTRNPNSIGARQQIANSLLWQGKYQEAVAAWRFVPRETNPSVIGSHSAWALFQLGRDEEALATIDEFATEYPDDTGGLLAGMRALVLAANGEERNSEAEIERATQKRAFGHFHHTAHYIADAYARMNKPDLAIYWLKEAAETGFPCYPLFERDDNLDSIRNDSRFVEFMKQLKTQWEHYIATM